MYWLNIWKRVFDMMIILYNTEIYYEIVKNNPVIYT